eukprot:m.589120 g.589120  ORF g.589120 m.589120 type:complete len:372 (+) comp22369_c0_seq6:1415-2530(+)
MRLQPLVSVARPTSSLFEGVCVSKRFNTSLGYFNGACDHWKQTDLEDGCGLVTDIWDSNKPGFGMNGTYGDYLYVGRAVDTITAHDSSTPLFYYLALQCAHDPMEAPQRFLDLVGTDVPNQVEYAFSAVIDEGVANVTNALKAKGMWDNTLMVVSADNGGPAFSDQHAASNFPLRGGKYQLWEGGIRVSAFVTGGFLPSTMRGTNISFPIHICDWYATFSVLAGADPTDNHEGVPHCIVPCLLQTVSFRFLSLSHMLAARTDSLRRSACSKISCGWCSDDGVLLSWQRRIHGAAPYFPMRVPLCGGATDAGEHVDVAAENPTVVQTMLARLTVLNNGAFVPQGPAVAKDAVCAATKLNGGYLTPSDWKSLA